MLHIGDQELAHSHTAEVYRALSSVIDPELDESIVGLGFVRRVTADARGNVVVDWRLPTHWCGVNFAYIMAGDMHAALAALPWVRQVAIELHDHMAAAEINLALRDGKSFGAVFDCGPGGTLQGLREYFAVKGFERRQGALIDILVDHGRTDARLAIMSLSDLDQLSGTANAARAAVDAYLDRRRRLGEFRPAVAGAPGAFIDGDGRPMTTGNFRALRRRFSLTRLNAELNTTVCRHLLENRGAGEVAPCRHR